MYSYFFNSDLLHARLKKVLQGVVLQQEGENKGEKHLGKVTRNNPKIIGCPLRPDVNPLRLQENEKHSSSKESQCLPV